MAAVDALRTREADERPAATQAELPDRDALAQQTAGLGVRGELLLYGDGCSVDAVALPALERTPQEGQCSPRGTRSPDGDLVAVCRDDETLVFYTEDGSLRNGYPGCAPAWQPDGTLTLSDARQVFTAEGSVLIGAAELERAARRHPTSPARAPLRVLVDAVAWLSNTRAAVLMSIRLAGRLGGMGPMAGIAFFEQGRLLATQSYFRVTGGRLGASPRGTYVTQSPDVILRGDGSQLSLPPHLRVAHAFAWTEDERSLAIATRFAVTILDVGSLERYDRIGSGLRSVTLPLPALDLVWR